MDSQNAIVVERATDALERAVRMNNFRPRPIDLERAALREWLAEPHGGRMLIVDVPASDPVPAFRFVFCGREHGLLTVTVQGREVPSELVPLLKEQVCRLLGLLCGRAVAPTHARVDHDGRVVLTVREEDLRRAA